MSDLAQVSKETELTQASPLQQMGDIVKANMARVVATLPKHMSPERFYQLAVSTVNRTPKLAYCPPVDVLSCLMKCSTLGLEPDNVDGLGRAYIIPSKVHGKPSCRFQIGYKGMLELMDRTGKIKSKNIIAVYEDDHIKLTLDENGIPHIKSTEVNFNAKHTPETLQFVFMHIEFTTGGEHNAYMTKAEIDKIRERSQSAMSKKQSPWDTDYEAMALKSLIRREFKYLPISIDIQQAVASDDLTPNYSDVFNPITEATAVKFNELTVDSETGEVIEEVEINETN